MAAGAACPWSGRSRWRIEAEGEGAEGRERDAPRVLGTQLGCVLGVQFLVSHHEFYQSRTEVLVRVCIRYLHVFTDVKLSQ